MTFAARRSPVVRDWNERVRSGAVWLLLTAWFAATTLVSATLLARHLIPLPEGDASAARLAAARPAREQNQWFLLHALYARCKCSERIVHRLSERGRLPGVSEVVLWVGTDATLEAKLATSGFPIERTPAEDLLRRYDVEAAPMLAILSPDDVVRYRGGYTERKQAYDIGDLRLLEQARSGGDPLAWPIFGCATSERLKQLLDPLQLF